MKDFSKYKWYQMMSVMVLAAVFATGCATTEKRHTAAQLAVAKTAVADAVSAGSPDFAPGACHKAQDTAAAA